MDVRGSRLLSSLSRSRPRSRRTTAFVLAAPPSWLLLRRHLARGRGRPRSVHEPRSEPRASTDSAYAVSEFWTPDLGPPFGEDGVKAGEHLVARPSENAEKSGNPGVRVAVPQNRGGDSGARCQAVFAIQWLWSFSRLCVAVTNRHSDCAAALPLRMNRSMCRLYLICPNTGSIVILRCA
jgi:hypothetical protein